MFNPILQLKLKKLGERKTLAQVTGQTALSTKKVPESYPFLLVKNDSHFLP